MLLIWGWRVLNAVLGTGLFYCPKCQVDTQYQHVRPRRWFTLFFIPVIPLNRLDPHVVCTRCKGTFYERVLQQPTMQQFEYQAGLAHRAAIAHLLSMVQQPSAEVSALAVQSLASAAGVPTSYGALALSADVAAFAPASVTEEQIRPLAEYMTLDGREAFLRRAAGLVFRLGPAKTPAMDEALTTYGDLLSMSRAHAEGIQQAVERELNASKKDGAL
jgi:hypothetical protein